MNRVEQFVESMVPGQTVASQDILHLENRNVLDCTLFRLKERKELRRLVPGLYIKIGGTDAEIEDPPKEEIMRLKAAAFKRNIAADASVHAAALELRQDADHNTAITDGATTSFKIGTTKVKLVHRGSKKMRLGDTAVGKVIRALHSIGKRNLTQNCLAKAVQKSGMDLRKLISTACALAPNWLYVELQRLQT